MTNEELKQALMSKCEVKYKETVYKCVYGIIYRNVSDKIEVLVELMDKNNNSVCVVNPKYVKFVSE